MRHTFLSVSIVVLMLPVGASAQDVSGRHPYFSNKHYISFGATRQRTDSEVTASVTGLPEVGLSLDDLGVKESYTSWMAEYRWRFKPKWGLVVAGYAFKSDGSIAATEDFNFNGIEFEAGVRVDTDVEIDTYIFDLMYSAYQNERSEIMLGGGVHMIDFSMGIEGKVFAGDIEASDQAGTSHLLAPLPNLRIQGFHALTNKWALGFTGGWLSATYGDYSGSFAYAHLRTLYRFTPHFSASVGYQYNGIDLTYEKSKNRETKLDMDFDGPTVQFTYIIK